MSYLEPLRDATPDNLQKLSQVIASGLPLKASALIEAIDLCARTWECQVADLTTRARTAIIYIRKIINAVDFVMAEWEQGKPCELVPTTIGQWAICAERELAGLAAEDGKT